MLILSQLVLLIFLLPHQKMAFNLTLSALPNTIKVILSSNNVFTFMVFEKVTAQKMKFSIKDFFSKFDQIRGKLRIWSHLLKKSFMENFSFSVK